MGEVVGKKSFLETPTPPNSAHPPQLYSPSLAESQFLNSTQRTPQTPSFISSPISPASKVIVNMQGYLEDVGHLTKFEPQDDWLPITESRKGNAYYSAFHTLNSGIGFQALLLPVAFTVLGWTWGIACLSLAFVWQFYTLWLLTRLHESVSGMRYSRYIHLAKDAFDEKRGKLLTLFPLMCLSGGTCVTIIIMGGGTMKLFFHTVYGPTSTEKPLTAVECYLVFTCLAIVLAQLPNLNSIAGISLVGAITAVGYCTLTWVVSVSNGSLPGSSHDPLKAKSEVARVFGVLNAVGIIAFAFRGHNLLLEIQGTMPLSQERPSHVPMWRGVTFAYLVIALCYFPLAIGGYWAYGNLIPANGGMLSALYKIHGHKASRAVLGLTSLLVVINGLSSFPIYAMPIFDNLEFIYTSKKNKPCPRWVRSGFRAFFGCLTFCIAVALPFLGSLAGLLGGIALPITLAYPCFMWIKIKKPQRYSTLWFVNWGLGSLGMVLSFLLVAGAAWSIAGKGFKANFFRPQ